jgi:hypothetical protein
MMNDAKNQQAVPPPPVLPLAGEAIGWLASLDITMPVHRLPSP